MEKHISLVLNDNEYQELNQLFLNSLKNKNQFVNDLCFDISKSKIKEKLVDKKNRCSFRVSLDAHKAIIIKSGKTGYSVNELFQLFLKGLK